jgi:DNA-binding MarR family transcriptional regulator
VDIIKELGELAFGSRLRRLVKRTDRDISRIYKQLSLDFHPHWFPLLIVLHKKKRASITYIANAILYSHTAVYKIATEMTNHGLLASNADSHDGRKRSLSLTKKGHDTVSSMIPIWEEIRFVTKELVGSSSHNILTAIGAIEEELDKKSVYNRIRECMESRMMDQIEIVDYMSRYKHHFSKLNRQWLQRYFSIEEHDELILERPYYEIIKKGGCILFARLNRRIVGTAALLKHGDGVFEHAKMAPGDQFTA